MQTTTENAPAAVQRPSPYQLEILRANGCRIRPASYDSARRRMGGTPPSANQVALLEELGIPVPGTRQEASDTLTAYELANPTWAAERRAARSAKGVATRRERREQGSTPNYNETLHRYHHAGVERFGAEAASLDALALLRAYALQLPQHHERRLEAFRAMAEGLTTQDARRRIDDLKPVAQR